ncbi:MAG: hypothetical protein QW194_04655 [Candidatus Micrarchaeaceae archaeon]|nr:hypothetical protein [Candidatus Parvarchaeum tengchongense]
MAGIIEANVLNIIDSVIAIIIVAIFATYRKVIWNRLRQARVKTIVGIIVIIIGFGFIVYGNSTYHPVNISISPNSFWSYYWDTMALLTVFDAMGVVLIFLGGFLINPQATIKIAHRITENIMRDD